MNLGFPELVVLFILALLLFGPKKLPELGKSIGKAITEFKKATNEVKEGLEKEVEEDKVDKTKEEKKELKG